MACSARALQRRGKEVFHIVGLIVDGKIAFRGTSGDWVLMRRLRSVTTRGPLRVETNGSIAIRRTAGIGANSQSLGSTTATAVRLS
jgi:hypothetical protein